MKRDGGQVPLLKMKPWLYYIEVLQLQDLSPMDVMEGSQFSPLLEDIEVEVQKELTREYRASSSSNEEMAPRIAHFKDELEKKDRIIAKLRKDNTALKVYCILLLWCGILYA